jgi:hypothetical protein
MTEAAIFAAFRAAPPSESSRLLRFLEFAFETPTSTRTPEHCDGFACTREQMLTLRT